MKVSAINIPTLKSYQVAVLGAIRSTQSVIVEMHTDEGLVGIGETDPALMFTGESQQTVMTMLKHHIKTTKHGGLLNSQKIAALTAAAGGKIFVNSMIEMGVSVMSGLHFAASTPSVFEIGHALNSIRRLRDDILKQAVLYDGGDIVVPQDCVGLGVELDEK